MSIRVDSNTDVLKWTGPLPDPTGATLQTLYGWTKIISDLGAVEQKICELKDAGNSRFALFLQWDKEDNTMWIASFSVDTFDFFEAQLASRPAVGDWFFWSISILGSGASGVKVRWSNYNSSTIVTHASAMQISGAATQTATDYMLSNAGGGYSNAEYACCGWVPGAWGDSEHLAQKFRAPHPSGAVSHIKIIGDTTGADSSGNGNNATVGGITAGASNPPVTTTVEAASASYTRTGSGVTLRADRTIPAASRAFSLTGSATALTKSYLPLQAASAAFTLNADGVTLKADRLIQAASAPYVLNGDGVTLTYVPNGTTYTLDCASATYTMVADGASLAVARYMDAASAAYQINASADLRVDRIIQAAAANYTLNGDGIDLRASRLIDAAAAQYQINASAVDLTTTQPQHYTIEAASAHYDLNAQDVTLTWSGEPVPDTRPDGAPGRRGKRIIFRGREYDSIRDRQYLAEALREVVEERIEPPKTTPKQRKKSKPAPQFTDAELVEFKPVLEIVAPQKSLADYVADLMAQEEEELFLLMAA